MVWAKHFHNTWNFLKRLALKDCKFLKRNSYPSATLTHNQFIYQDTDITLRQNLQYLKSNLLLLKSRLRID